MTQITTDQCSEFTVGGGINAAQITTDIIRNDLVSRLIPVTCRIDLLEQINRRIARRNDPPRLRPVDTGQLQGALAESR